MHRSQVLGRMRRCLYDRRTDGRSPRPTRCCSWGREDVAALLEPDALLEALAAAFAAAARGEVAAPPRIALAVRRGRRACS